ncbi:hypothetical protein HK102_007475 [Quaeritorhiza haematococci]|nr:hypothetical protein HK102_007475 [Quaeritorhiza haematococci]
MLYNKILTVAPWLRRIAGVQHPQKLKNVLPNLAVWGASAGILLVMFMEPTPIFRRDVLVKVPVAGSFWQHKLEEAEKKD